ncbi:ribonuclease H-like YkuK family protein [Patescibacteria group bacterium]
MQVKNGHFVSPTQGILTVPKVVGEISKFVDYDPARFYRVIIGTDSQSRNGNGNSEVDFVTAVVIHRGGHGARYFWRKEKTMKKMVLRDKIYTETQMSLNTAQEIVPLIRKEISAAKYDLEIHIDVGALGPTREMIKEVVGMVTGNGYVAKTKPESWGASTVADKHT